MAGESTAAQRLATLFRGLERSHGVYHLPKRNGARQKVEGRAETVPGAVTVELWEKHLRGELGVGVVPINDDNVCCWGAIDVDRYGESVLGEMEALVRLHQLPLLPVRSKSGGVHLYTFLSSPVAAGTVRQKLGEWASGMGLDKPEVFPKQDRLTNDMKGSWLNMPYFGALKPGHKVDRYAVFDGDALSLDDFLSLAEKLQHSAIKIIGGDSGTFEQGPPCLQCLFANGTPSGNRNTLLFNIAVYYRKRGDEAYTEKVMDYSGRFSQPLPPGELKKILRSVKHKDYNYTCEQTPLKEVCNRKLCLTRKFGVGDGNDVFIERVVKHEIPEQDPQYDITANGKTVTFVGEEITSQIKFRNRCFFHFGQMPGRKSGENWDKYITELQNGAEVVRAPMDSSNLGKVLRHLTGFCTGSMRGDTREELRVDKSFCEDGVVYFRGQSFLQYLANRGVKLEAPLVWQLLRSKGVDNKDFKIGKQVLSVWYFEESMLYEAPVMEPVPAHHIPAPEGEM